MNLIDQLTEFLHEIGYEVLLTDFVMPPNAEMGDVALPCFALAKQLGRSPAVIAKEIIEKAAIKLPPLVSDMRAEGPYVNFVLDPSALAQFLKERGDDTTKKSDATILFEYSQPNTHKAFHIGHLRNALLGAALVKLYEAAGNAVRAVTYVNDVGTHVAQTLWAFQKFHGGKAPKTERGRWLGTVYAEAANAVAENPALKDEVQEVLQKLESHDPELLKQWKETRQWSLDGFAAIYKTLGISFDSAYYESDVRERGHHMVDELLERGIAVVSEGATIMDLTEYGLEVLVIRKSDGTGLYATSDLGLAEAKSKEKCDVSIVITDIRQALYFKQLFKTLELFGMTRPQRHIGYEFVTLKTGQMSSRKGNVVLFEDFFDEVVASAEKETRVRHTEWDEEKVRVTGEKIALAAIKFGMLKVKPSQVIVFDPTEQLSFDGFNGPYVLYTFARIQSILKKAGVEAGAARIFSDAEKPLLMHIAWFSEVVAGAVSAEDPSAICKYLFDVCQEFGSYYERVRVLSDDETERASRLWLVGAVAQLLENGLKLLGIETVNEM